MPGQHEQLTDALHEPGFYARDPFPHLARLRAEAPVAWNDTLGYWALSRHAEVHEVSTEPARFCSGKGILTMEIGTEYDSPPTMMHTDPPEHTAYRKLVQPGFKPSLMKALVPVARERLLDLFDQVQDGEAVDFVPAVSVPFPLRIIGDLLGLPDRDWEQFFHWSEAMTGAIELTPEEREAIQGDMRAYFFEVIRQKRVEPAEDLISVLSAEDLTDDELYMFLNQLLVAGNETTRNTISGGIWALAERPDQWQRLVDDPSLLTTSVEEILRWTTAVIAFMRTATVDTELGGVPIAAGDPVLMLYSSANRDEAVFGPTADQFDVGREPNPHLAFGFGAHFCIGAALARLEVRLVLEELLARFRTLEPAGEVAYSPSDIIAGVTSAPVRFTV
ncbi:MAG TPA: cytochrome P450 [Acidimicrobiales bacterium]